MHIRSITFKTYESQLAALTKRLTPELSVLYTQGYDGNMPTPGMNIYEELEAQMKKMRPLRGLIQAYHATQGKMATAEALRREQTFCQVAGVTVSSVLSDIVDPSKEVDMGLGKLDDYDKKELQSNVILVQVINLLRSGTGIPKEEKEERERVVLKATDSLHNILQSPTNKSVKVLDEDLERDVNRRTVLAQVAVCGKDHV